MRHNASVLFAATGDVRRGTAVRMWLIGLVVGAAAIVLLVFLAPLGIAAIVAAALMRPRPAAAGGVSIAVGTGFLLALWRAADQCAAFNRQPQANCTMGDNSPFALVGALLLGLGIALSAYALTRSNTGARRVAQSG